LSLWDFLTVMPSPSFPTGTVSRASLGTRTFPPDDVDSPDCVGDATGGHPTARTAGATARTSPSAPTPAPTPATDGGPSVSKGETLPGAAPHDAARSGRDAVRRSPTRADGDDLHERVAELERENAALRRDLKRKQREQQDVIDRYERVIADLRDDADEKAADGDASTLEPLSPSSASPSSSASSSDSADGPLRRLAARIGDRLGVRERWR
jgi:hypothetical protein